MSRLRASSISRFRTLPDALEPVEADAACVKGLEGAMFKNESESARVCVFSGSAKGFGMAFASENGSVLSYMGPSLRKTSTAGGPLSADSIRPWPRLRARLRNQRKRKKAAMAPTATTAMIIAAIGVFGLSDGVEGGVALGDGVDSVASFGSIVPTNMGDTLIVAAFPVSMGIPVADESKTSLVGRAVLASSVAVLTPFPW